MTSVMVWLLLGACGGAPPLEIAVRVDADGDGAFGAQDCDDADPMAHPGAEERCNGFDDDCDGAIDEDPSDATQWYADGDGDGWGDSETSWTACEDSSGAVGTDGDCDDTEADTNPAADERCDGIDQDCDGLVDEDLTFETWYADADLDGYGDAETSLLACTQPDGFVADGSDCDDAAQVVHPGAAEVCDDAVDNDCDGLVDADAVSVCHFSGAYALSGVTTIEFGAMEKSGPNVLYTSECELTGSMVVDATASPAVSGSMTCAAYDSERALEEWSAWSGDTCTFMALEFAGELDGSKVLGTLTDAGCGRSFVFSGSFDTSTHFNGGASEGDNWTENWVTMMIGFSGVQ